MCCLSLVFAKAKWPIDWGIDLDIDSTPQGRRLFQLSYSHPRIRWVSPLEQSISLLFQMRVLQSSFSQSDK